MTSLLTPEEVAERCKVKPSTVRGWLRAGTLPGVRLPGGTWRINPADLDTHLDTAADRHPAGAR